MLPFQGADHSAQSLVQFFQAPRHGDVLQGAQQRRRRERGCASTDLPQIGGSL